MADPTHRLIELTGFGRRGEDVSDAAADRPLEQIGGQLIGDQDGPHVRPAGEQVLGTAEARLGCGRGSQHEHHGDTGEALIDPRRSSSGVARSPSCMAMRLRTAGSASITTMGALDSSEEFDMAPGRLSGWSPER